MGKMIDCLRPIECDLGKVEALLKKSFHQDSRLLKRAADHFNKGGGKRLRPALLLLSARAAGRKSPHLIPLAVSMELLHSATLVHDDIIDVADLRRGQPCVNTVWSDGVSVVLGDYFLSLVAMNLSSNKMGMHPIHTIARTMRDLCVGEMLQLENVDNFDLCGNDYLKIIKLKTARLMETCCLLGATGSKRSSSRLGRRLAAYGLNFGMAFQITDDLADLYLDGKQANKSPANDAKHGKVTLPAIHALRKCNRLEKEMLANMLRKRDEHIGQLRKSIMGKGGVDYSLTQIKSFLDRASGFLRGLPVDKRRPFEELITYLLDRADKVASKATAERKAFDHG